MTEPQVTGARPLPRIVTPSPIGYPQPRVSLDTVIGNNPMRGGPKEKRTLRQWLESDNRTPQFRARRLALRLIEQQERDLAMTAARPPVSEDGGRYWAFANSGTLCIGYGKTIKEARRNVMLQPTERYEDSAFVDEIAAKLNAAPVSEDAARLDDVARIMVEIKRQPFRGGTVYSEAQIEAGIRAAIGSVSEDAARLDDVERVARAMAKADGKDPDAPAWVRQPGNETFGICWRDQYSDKARAAIEALSASPPKSPPAVS